MKRALALLVAAGSVLWACGGDDAPEAGGTATAGDEIVVKATEFKFDPADLSIGAARDYTVVLDNSDGKVEHDWVVDGTEIKILAPPRRTAEGTVRLDEPGTYAIYCSIAGHREAGMEGTLVVE
jgi:cytochrome c oxidase subunit 2